MAELATSKDFFISYTRADKIWAEWIAFQLEEAGYTTILQAWDFPPASNFILEMQQAADRAKRIILVLSTNFPDTPSAELEWIAFFAQDLNKPGGKVLPVRVSRAPITGLLSSLVYIDLVDQNEIEARDMLLSRVRPERAKPPSPPTYPGFPTSQNLPDVPPTPPGAQSFPTLSSESIQFRAFYPKAVVVEKWQTLLVYAHTVSALQAVRADAAKFKEEMGVLPGEKQAQPMQAVFPGTEITIVPVCQGVVFNPERQSFIWAEDWHLARFRFRADQKLAESASSGEIIIYAGPLIIATLNVAFLFEVDEQALSLPNKENSAEVVSYLYHQIFASYSHDDTSIVLACREVYKGLGFNTLIDLDTLRTGQNWNKELMRMIDEADIFQLFWSANAARSRYVHREWKHALQRSKSESFIRPVYWEKPLVSPPRELKKLHFLYIHPPQLN